VKFTGEAIGVYGTVSADHSDVRVNIDGQDRKTGGTNGLANGLHTQTLLYFEDSLGSGEHTMVVSANPRPDGGPPFIDIDSMSVFASVEDGAAAPGAAGSASGSSAPSRALIGGIVGGVLGLLLILALILLLLRRSRRQWLTLSKKRGGTNPSPLSPPLPIQTTPSMMEAGVPPAKPAMSFTEFSESRQPIVPSYYGESYLSPPVSRIPSFASSRNSTALLLGKDGFEEILLPPPPPAKVNGAKISGTPTRPKQRPPTMNFAL